MLIPFQFYFPKCLILHNDLCSHTYIALDNTNVSQTHYVKRNEMNNFFGKRDSSFIRFSICYPLISRTLNISINDPFCRF